MSLADLRKELKDLRKKAMPVPVSRMKKTDVARELERLKGLHHTEVKKVEEVLLKEEVPKKTAKKVKAVQEVEHTKQEEVVKRTKSVKAETKKPEAKKPESSAEVSVPTTKPAKGSEEMKAKMAALRAARKKKE